MDIASINQINNYFRDKPVQKAYLFGSRQTGRSRKDSDIDILVELDHSSSIGLKFIRMRMDLEDMLGRKVDLLTDDSISRHIKPYIDSEKKLIYDRRNP